MSIQVYNTAGRIPPFEEYSRMLFHKDTLPTLVAGLQYSDSSRPKKGRRYPVLPAGLAQETCRLPQIKERAAVTGGQLNIGEGPSVDHQQFICSLRNHIVDQCTIEIS